MKQKIFIFIFLILALSLSFTPSRAFTGDWSLSFRSNKDLKFVENGNYKINSDCELVSNNFWVKSTGPTGSWSLSVKYNSVSDGKLVYYPTVVDDTSANHVEGVPDNGYFLIFNWYEHNLTEFTRLDFWFRNKTADNWWDFQPVGARKLYSTILDGWQRILITRNANYEWEVYLNNSLVISPTYGNFSYEDDWSMYFPENVGNWTTSKYSVISVISTESNLKFTHLTYTSQLLKPHEVKVPNYADLCGPDTETVTINTTKETTIISTVTNGSKTASLSFFPILIGLIIIVLKKKN
jgi:hypothetical protein